jgi:hypothetical protein
MAVSSQGQGQEGGGQPWRHAGGSTMPYSAQWIAKHVLPAGAYGVAAIWQDKRLQRLEVTATDKMAVEAWHSGGPLYFFSHASDMIAWLLGALAEAEERASRAESDLLRSRQECDLKSLGLATARAHITGLEAELRKQGEE